MGRKAFGSYMLEERLAVGGMGELFLASTSADRPLSVVKILHRDFLESEDFVSMFEDEGRIGARLAHPNIVGVHDTGKVGDVPFISFEFIDGENLRSVLKASTAVGMPVPPEIAVRIAVGVLLGLDHAHRAKDERGRVMNLVHRDLSPDNIVISWDGEPKILDFGIAKADGRSTHTQVGVLKGKSQYMAPEQAKLGLVDQRSDLFSAGVVLLELLTGKKRFELEDPLAQILAAQEWSATRPSDQAPWLPVEIDAIVLKALARAPENRFQSAEEFAVALTRVLQQGMLPRSESIASFLRRVFPGRTKRAGLGSADEQTLHPRSSSATAAGPRTPSPTARKPQPVFAPPPVDIQRNGEESTRTATAEAFNDAQTRAGIAAPGFPDEGATSSSPVPRFDDEHTENAERPTARTRPAPSAAVVPTAAPAETPSRATEPPVPGPTIRPPGSTPRIRFDDIPIDDNLFDGADETPLPPAAPPSAGGRSEIRRGVPLAAKRGSPGRRRILKSLLGVGLLAGLVAAASEYRARIESIPQVASAVSWTKTRFGFALASSDVAAPDPGPILVEPPPAASPAATPSVALVIATPETFATPVPVPTIRDADLAKPLSASVRVTSDPPGFEVLVDYVPTGKKTPATILLTPGSHVVGVDAPGFRAWEYEETFRAGTTVIVPAALIAEE